MQLGTLGGGNHFMEAQVAEDGTIWLMVHSGSRHTGLRIADYYNQKAIESTERRKFRAQRSGIAPHGRARRGGLPAGHAVGRGLRAG